MKNTSITNYAEYLVRNYATFDKLINGYNLEIRDIPSFDLHKFASLFLKDRLLANECFSQDNPDFERIIIPSLIRLFSNSTSKDEQVEFIEECTDGVINYFYRDMQSLIEESLQIYNMEHAA